jgi:L-ribulose-5-phosphate 3-epimerase
MQTLSRRQVLERSLALTGLSLGFSSFVQDLKKSGFGIGACDWSIGQSGKVEAMQVAAQIGLDGVQVNMGSLKDNMHLRQKDVQKAYLEASKKYNVGFSGLALGELNDVPYKSDPRTDQWVADSIDVAKVLGVKVVLLAFFAKNDLKHDLTGTRRVIAKLKEVMPMAEKAGVTLGVESWLNATEHLYIIDKVGSPNLRIYYDVANSNHMGYDIYKEIRELGQEKMICEIHAKENDFLLGKGRVNFDEVRKAIDEIGYRGWLQIEGAVPKGGEMLPSYIENLKFLRGVFPKEI